MTPVLPDYLKINFSRGADMTCNQSSEELALLVDVLQKFLNRRKQKTLCEFMDQVRLIVFASGYHHCDIFQALSDIAAREVRDGHPETKPTWETVAALLQSAAEAAATKGRELP